MGILKSILHSERGGTGGIDTIDTLVDLPASPTDGDQVILEVVDGEPIALRYDGATSEWWAYAFDDTATIFDGSDDPWTEELNDGAGSYASGGGSLTFSHTSAASSTNEDIRLYLPVLLPVSMGVRFYRKHDATGQPSVGLYQISVILESAATLFSGARLSDDLRHDSGSSSPLMSSTFRDTAGNDETVNEIDSTGLLTDTVYNSSIETARFANTTDAEVGFQRRSGTSNIRTFQESGGPVGSSWRPYARSFSSDSQAREGEITKIELVTQA